METVRTTRLGFKVAGQGRGDAIFCILRGWVRFSHETIGAISETINEISS